MRKLAPAWLGVFALLAAPAPATELAADEVQFVTLGTGGGPLPRIKRSEPANALVVNGAVYLLQQH
jgi:hypothetical protein